MTDTFYRLPPLPTGIKRLTNVQAALLNEMSPQTAIAVGDCVTCRGRKTFRWYAPDRPRSADSVVTYECDCKGQYLMHRWFSYAGIPKAYQRLGWADFTHLPDEAAAVALDYLDRSEAYADRGRGIILSGSKGSGKTLMANLILKELIATKGVKGREVIFTKMIDQYASGWNDKAQERWFNIEVRSAGLLLIDDLGRERNKGPEAVGTSMLEGVVRHRVGEQQPTIMTTNLSPEEIAQGYGGNTMSLLTECSSTTVIQAVDRRDEMRLRGDAETDLGLTRPIVVS